MKRLWTFTVPLASAGVCAAAFVIMCVRSLVTPAPIWVEGPIIGFMEAIRAGRLYQLDALAAPPYSVLTHPPLSYLLDYALYSIWPAFWPLRLLNMFVTAGCALLIGLYVRLEARGPTAAPFFAAGVFLATTPVFLWSQNVRSVDSLCCFFSLCALLISIHCAQNIWRELAIAAFLSLAILSKQTSAVVLTPALLLQDVWILRKPWRMIWWPALGFCILAPVFVYLQWASAGGFLENIVGANLVRMSFAQWRILNEELLRFWLFTAVVLFIAGCRRRNVAYFWFAISCVFGLLTIAKLGSGTMYFFDTCAAIAIISGIALQAAVSNYRPWLVSLLVLSLAFLLVGSVRWRYLNSPRRTEEHRRIMALLRARQAPGQQILSEDASVPVALGLTPLWDDPFVFHELALKGRWQDAVFVSAIHQRQYFALVTRDINNWTLPMQKEIREQYDPAGNFRFAVDPPYTVYLPRNR